MLNLQEETIKIIDGLRENLVEQRVAYYTKQHGADKVDRAGIVKEINSEYHGEDEVDILNDLLFNLNNNAKIGKWTYLGKTLWWEGSDTESFRHAYVFKHDSTDEYFLCFEGYHNSYEYMELEPKFMKLVEVTVTQYKEI